MAEIDWSGVAQEAEDSPRGQLAAWVARVEEIKQIVIIVETKDMEIEVGWSFLLNDEKSSLTILGLLDTAKFKVLRAQEEGLED